MPGVIAIRNETKSRWERRAPLTPELVKHLVHDRGVSVLVQPSSRRVFHDKEYVRAGASMTTNLEPADVVFGVKEIPPELIEPGKTYAFFSHVIKGQPQNMPTLKRLIDLGCTLIDYEKVTDAHGKRLIFFGRFAGLAGMIDTLWAVGRKYKAQGITTPFYDLDQAFTYDSLADATNALSDVAKKIADHGLPAEIVPLTIGVAGYGNVSKGAQEILAELPLRHVAPGDLGSLVSGGSVSAHCVYSTIYEEADLVEPVDSSAAFDLQHYYTHPEAYRSRFDFAPLSVLVNANYWDERYPRLITLEALRSAYSGDARPKLQVIGDLGCDIGGNVECTLKCTDPGDPVFTWDPDNGRIQSGFDGRGPSILAVDFLPTELPREASDEFASTLGHFVAAIGRADYSVPFARLDLPEEVKRAVIVHRGELTPDYRSLALHLPPA